jgi:hypothetical protein
LKMGPEFIPDDGGHRAETTTFSCDSPPYVNANNVIGAKHNNPVDEIKRKN